MKAAEVGDQGLAIIGVADTDRHGRAGIGLLRIGQEGVEARLVPLDALGAGSLQGIGIAEILGRTDRAADDAEQGRSLELAHMGAVVMAQGALVLEYLLALRLRVGASRHGKGCDGQRRQYETHTIGHTTFLFFDLLRSYRTGHYRLSPAVL